MSYNKDAEYSVHTLTPYSKQGLLTLLEQAVESLKEEIETGEEEQNGTYAYNNIESIVYAMRNYEG